MPQIAANPTRLQPARPYCLRICIRLCLLLLAASPTSSSAQGQGGTFFVQDWNWKLDVQYSRVVLDPRLPRDLIHHENHPDDASFLFGDPGTTTLPRIAVTLLEPSVGLAYRLGRRNLALLAEYAATIPISRDGRQEQQQSNDPRPAANGSFVYTQVGDVAVGHIPALGVMLSTNLSRSEDTWLHLEGLVRFGRWDMVFEKGWSRFGKDQPSLFSEPRGLVLSPSARVTVGTRRWALLSTLALTQVSFSPRFLEHHTATGYGFSLGGRIYLNQP